MMLARTTYQRKLELFGNIIADAISDDLIYEDDMDSDDFCKISTLQYKIIMIPTFVLAIIGGMLDS